MLYEVINKEKIDKFIQKNFKKKKIKEEYLSFFYEPVLIHNDLSKQMLVFFDSVADLGIGNYYVHTRKNSAGIMQTQKFFCLNYDYLEKNNLLGFYNILNRSTYTYDDILNLRLTCSKCKGNNLKFIEEFYTKKEGWIWAIGCKDCGRVDVYPMIPQYRKDYDLISDDNVKENEY